MSIFTLLHLYYYSIFKMPSKHIYTANIVTFKQQNNVSYFFQNIQQTLGNLLLYNPKVKLLLDKQLLAFV